MGIFTPKTGWEINAGSLITWYSAVFWTLLAIVEEREEIHYQNCRVLLGRQAKAFSLSRCQKKWLAESWWSLEIFFFKFIFYLTIYLINNIFIGLKIQKENKKIHNDDSLCSGSLIIQFLHRRQFRYLTTYW